MTLAALLVCAQGKKEQLKLSFDIELERQQRTLKKEGDFFFAFASTGRF